MRNKKLTKEAVFEKIRGYLKPVPLILWGNDRSPHPGDRYNPSPKDKQNLFDGIKRYNDRFRYDLYNPVMLGDLNHYENHDYRRIVYRYNTSYIDRFMPWRSFSTLIKYFYSENKILNIITTNYDCVLDYLLGYLQYPFSDGFGGREFSRFDKSNFKTKNSINLYKIKGSINWTQGAYSHYATNMDSINDWPCQDHFSEIIKKSKELIEKSTSFLLMGFEFDDRHITPEINKAIEQGKNIVIVTKEATISCKKQLLNASKYILIEGNVNDYTTKIKIKNGDSKFFTILPGRYDSLLEFVKILS